MRMRRAIPWLRRSVLAVCMVAAASMLVAMVGTWHNEERLRFGERNEWWVLSFGGNIRIFKYPVREDGVAVPHFVLFLVLMAYPLWVVWGARARRVLADREYHRQRYAEAAGVCPGCGYDLRASPGRCPECGRLRGRT